ncbi:MAG TPA: ABC transporter ATP-binding protein [Actinocrinis sp.]|uniref:ABC transporter ATP-binding protein n=1 Tax=Actinocrinis sp. TaxID=1920516 RepID=UPI002DDCBE7B|nr:ABC transporter ATP-binding protein [Actinocrinis sp.]HEV2346882.1 ABC transporter ATP-binding protein [Actinocrinis sp.]
MSRPDPILHVSGLTVTLGGSAILHGVSFDVAATGVTALLGRNGVGKTTTVRSVLGLNPAGGEIRFAGRDISALPTHRRARRGIGYVPEDRVVFSGLTVEENLRLAEPARGVPRYELVHDLFPVLRERARQRAGTLSGGEQQMLALGRALLGPARLLLVDEPTKGLSPKYTAMVAAALGRMAEQVPILLVEQNLAVVRRTARDAVVLDMGRVVHTGDARDLLADPSLTNRLLGVSAPSAQAAETAGINTAATEAPAIDTAAMPASGGA